VEAEESGTRATEDDITRGEKAFPIHTTCIVSASDLHSMIQPRPRQHSDALNHTLFSAF
jgi:hypothetical protein